MIGLKVDQSSALDIGRMGLLDGDAGKDDLP